jgi:S-(hydroxymethyl)glutathione dehydrogenase/alcohol dehydrogenase
MKFKAAVLFDVKKPLEICEIELANKLKDHQVLVKVHFSGVCHSQVMEADGFRGEDKYLPHLLGHEGVGEVFEIGPGVSKTQVGDKVVLTWIKGSGVEAESPSYKFNNKVINAGKITTFNEYAIVSENRLFKIPETAPSDLSVLLGCALPTGAGIVLNQIQVQPESTCLVWGLGGVGMSALLALKSLAPSKIVGVDASNDKLEFSLKSGLITKAFNSESNTLKQDLMSLTENKGFDFVIEAAGSVLSIETAFSFVRKFGGKMVFASHPPEGHKISLDPHDLISGKNIIGTWGGSCVPERDSVKLLSLIGNLSSSSSILLRPVYKLEEINLALESLRLKKAFRPLIDLRF